MNQNCPAISKSLPPFLHLEWGDGRGVKEQLP